MSPILTRLILFVVWLYRHDYRLVSTTGKVITLESVVGLAETYCDEAGL